MLQFVDEVDHIFTHRRPVYSVHVSPILVSRKLRLKNSQNNQVADNLHTTKLNHHQSKQNILLIKKIFLCIIVCYIRQTTEIQTQFWCRVCVINLTYTHLYLLHDLFTKWTHFGGASYCHILIAFIPTTHKQLFKTVHFIISNTCKISIQLVKNALTL